MSDVIQNDEVNNGQGGEILLGDEASRQAISFKMAQAFYSEITGKSEKICERLKKSFILTVENVDQLHRRILQATTQYNVASANVSFSVVYQNDSSERFSSIERFIAHAGCKGIPVEEVDINYNYLFVLPGTQKPQEYRINIRLISRMVKLEDLRERMSGMPVSMPLWQFDGRYTCRASIDYIDITVANSLMSVIKNWNNGLDEVATISVVKNLRPLARYLPAVFKYGLLAAGSCYTLAVVDEYFSSPVAQTTAIFILTAYIFNFVLWKVGLFTGKKSEHHLNQLYEVSYISFSGCYVPLSARPSIPTYLASDNLLYPELKQGHLFPASIREVCV